MSREVAENLLNTLLEKMQYREACMDGWALKEIQKALGTYSGKRILGYKGQIEGLTEALNSYRERNQKLREQVSELLNMMKVLLKELSNSDETPDKYYHYYHQGGKLHLVPGGKENEN